MRTRNRSCTGKRRFETKESAENEMWRAKRKVAAKVHVYRCRFCGGYHLGHKPRRR